jgi:Tol biopolymer transport system component
MAKTIFAVGLSQRSEVIRYDLGSRRFVPYLSGISAEGLAFSRDGQWVAYTSYPDGMLWRSKVDGSERLQLTFRPMRRAFLPRWSPDGKQIAFNAIIPDASWNIFLVSSNGGTPERIFPSGETQMDVNWSPDGNSLVFGSVFIPNAPIYIIDLRSKHVSPLPGSNGIFSPHWSPDGKQIAGITTATRTLMLFDFASQKWTELFGYAVGYENWSRDGKYLYFQDFHDHAPALVTASSGCGLVIARSRTWASLEVLGVPRPERSGPGLDLLRMTLRYSPATSALQKSIRSKWTGLKVFQTQQANPSSKCSGSS